MARKAVSRPHRRNASNCCPGQNRLTGAVSVTRMQIDLLMNAGHICMGSLLYLALNGRGGVERLLDPQSFSCKTPSLSAQARPI